MTFTPWQIGRIRSRLLTYYYHKKSYVTQNAVRSSKIKKKERMEDRGWSQDTIGHRHSYRWMDVAREIIASKHTSLSFPDNPDDDAPEDNAWDVTEESLRRFSDGVDKAATKDSRGKKFRAIQVPSENALKAIYIFLKKEVHYLADDDFVEPNSWYEPDPDLMFEIGADHDKLRISQFPLLISRDYISYSSAQEVSLHSLLSVDSKYTYKPARIRVVTQENFDNNRNLNTKTGFTPRWSWYWGWMVYPSKHLSIIKLYRDNPLDERFFAFSASNFADDGDHISHFSMSDAVIFNGNIADKYIVETMKQLTSAPQNAQRCFRRCTHINLTNIVRNYRFDLDDIQRPAVLGYKDTPEGKYESVEPDEQSRSLVEELFSKIRNTLPFGRKRKRMATESTPKKEKYFGDHLIFHDKNEVMVLSLEEVIKQNRLGERLLDTMEFGYPWHIAELIELGADPNHTSPETNASALHFIASNSSGGHLAEFTKAVAACGKNLMFNVKTKQGDLPSNIAASDCVDPDMVEYFFKMEALEREGRSFTPYVLPEVNRGLDLGAIVQNLEP